ncbi:MAG: hypothetical protein BAJATHORv1_110054 [Candidatus Thorarchaeota archaeon]|nr:MAG: hypothetical protein BAJATHORv1_110054 [Candidatus Thorarchaeota archaeon]
MSFDEVSIAYDNSIDWKKRLDREIPFIVNTLHAPEESEILDMACGTGRHAVELASKGANVTAFDNSISMIHRAKHFAELHNAQIHFFVADMMNMSEHISKSFDLVICLGNSLALLKTWKEVEYVIRVVHDILVQEGSFIFQSLNFEEILLSGFRLFPMKSGETPRGNEVVFGRFFDHIPGSDYSQLILSSFLKMSKDWEVRVENRRVLQFKRDLIEPILTRTGFREIEFFSDYSKSTFHSSSSRNMIVQAKK